MRRYLDLVAHQQLRAYLAQTSDTPSRAVYPRLLSGAEIAERIGATDAIIGDLRTAESLSNRHWTLVMLRREPGWRGSGQVVEIRGQSATLILPELALETPVHPDRLPALDTVLPVILRSLDLPRLDARFRVVRHETQP
jgi:exoribonuclease-2